MSAGTVTVRRADDGTYRVVLELDTRFRSAEEADDAAYFLAEHVRTRLGDVLHQIRAAGAS